PREAPTLLYRIAGQSISDVAAKSHIPTGAWRSVAHSQHGFFTECFMDELAVAAKADPYLFRQKHLAAGSRERAVLDLVAEKSGWGTALPARRGRGIALVKSFGSIVAEVVEASVDERGRVRVHRVTAAVDCGFVMHPDTARQQVEGGIIMGLSSALGEKITIDKGAVVETNFDQYPVMQLADTPQIDVHFVSSGAELGGLGEPGLPPVAPALANALFAATGKRVRALPLGQAYRA
ncbi:MAG: hypothetical protein RL291_651, partial [Pseudomonadota bacterium]